jgi:hypothetical protein
MLPLLLWFGIVDIRDNYDDSSTHYLFACFFCLNSEKIQLYTGLLTWRKTYNQLNEEVPYYSK